MGGLHTGLSPERLLAPFSDRPETGLDAFQHDTDPPDELVLLVVVVLVLRPVAAAVALL